MGERNDKCTLTLLRECRGSVENIPLILFSDWENRREITLRDGRVVMTAFLRCWGWIRLKEGGDEFTKVFYLVVDSDQDGRGRAGHRFE